MNYSLVQRTASIFGEQEWQEIPWVGTNKGVEQVIFDYGLRLGRLLERADTLSKKGDRYLSDVTALSDELVETFNGIQNLSDRYSSPGVDSSRMVSAKDHNSQQATPAAGPTGLHLRVVALGIQLMACATGYAVTLKATGPVTAAPESSIINPINPQLFDIQVCKEWFDNKRIALALEIYKTSIKYLSNGNAVMGASRVIFPLRLAFEHLEISSDEYIECRALLQKLEGKGMEFIPALNRNESIASRIIRHRRSFTALKIGNE